MDETWEQQVADLWSAIDRHEPGAFLEKMRALAQQRPSGDAIALFELASANDSTGHPEEAAPLYRQALAIGLTGVRRRRATIQLASTLRNLGHAEESVDLLTTELTAGSDDLDDAVIAALALALVDVGREREGAALAIGALAKHLKRYNRSMSNYARALLS